MNTGKATLNNKIETAWTAVRDQQPAFGTEGRREFRTRMSHLIAEQLGTNFDRVRQRIQKIERVSALQEGAPHCPTCTCAED